MSCEVKLPEPPDGHRWKITSTYGNDKVVLQQYWESMKIFHGWSEVESKHIFVGGYANRTYPQAVEYAATEALKEYETTIACRTAVIKQVNGG